MTQRAYVWYCVVSYFYLLLVCVCQQARNLQAFGELPTNARINQTAVDMAMEGGEGQEEDMGFDFEDVRTFIFHLYLTIYIYLLFAKSEYIGPLYLFARHQT